MTFAGGEHIAWKLAHVGRKKQDDIPGGCSHRASPAQAPRIRTDPFGLCVPDSTALCHAHASAPSLFCNWSINAMCIAVILSASVVLTPKFPLLAQGSPEPMPDKKESSAFCTMQWTSCWQTAGFRDWSMRGAKNACR
jgi:hypothetical protein